MINILVFCTHINRSVVHHEQAYLQEATELIRGYNDQENERVKVHKPDKC